MLNKSFSLLLFLFLLPILSAQGDLSCDKVFYNYRELNKIKSMRFMSLNAENFFLKVGKYSEFTDDKFYKEFRTPAKPEKMVDAVSQTILDTQPDLIVLQEVNGVSLEYLAKEKLKSQWISFLVKGNDRRGIGFLIKADIPIDVEARTHRDTRWDDPANPNPKGLLFARDFPTLILRRQGETQPVMLLIGAHAHSKWSRKNNPESPTKDPDSTMVRTAEILAMEKILLSYKKEFGENVPIILGGDFNTAVEPGSEVQPLLNQLKEVFAVVGVPPSSRYTHYFMNNKGEKKLSQIDALMMTPSLAPFVERAFVYPYKMNAKNEPLPSDHYPVIMDVSTQVILPEAHGQ